jgi:hypothetical protein
MCFRPVFRAIGRIPDAVAFSGMPGYFAAAVFAKVTVIRGLMR